MENERKWEDLPTDCLVSVFAKVPLEEKTLGVPFVCKSWHKALQVSGCWKILNLYPLYAKSFDTFAERFKQEYWLNNFSLAGFLKLLVSKSQGFAEEIIFYDGGATWEDLIYVSSHCPELKIRVLPLIEYHKVHFSTLASTLWKNLERLYMGNNMFLFEDVLPVICSNCTNISGLQMIGFPHNDDRIMALRFLSKLPNLTYLCLSSTLYLPKELMMVILECCKSLEELYMRNALKLDLDQEVIVKASNIRTFKFDCVKPPDEHEDEYPYQRLEFGGCSWPIACVFRGHLFQ